MNKVALLLAAAAVSMAAMAQQPAGGCCESCCKAPDYKKFGLFYEQRATLFDRLPVADDAIVMLGNSITNGCEWHELLDNPKVINRGISGDIVEGVDTRMGSLINGQPAKIFLMIGVNDVSHDLSADSIAGDIHKLVRRIRTESPRTRLYLQSCLPINNNFGRYKRLTDKEQVVTGINDRLQQIAVEEGLTYIDLFSLMADDEGRLRTDLTNDGLHLLGPAYMIWRDAIRPYVNE